MKNSFCLIFAIFLIVIGLAITSAQKVNYGPNWDKSCNENSLCTAYIYSYEKYWHNSSNDWEEINESFYACSEGGITRYCSRDYYYQTILDNRGNASASIGNSLFLMRVSNFLNSQLSFNPVVNGSVITYEDVIPSYVDIRYQYLPRKLKEEIIIKQLPRNLPARDFNITFHVARNNAFFIEPTFICDANMVCRYIPVYLEENRLKIEVPVSFLTNANTTYPVIIDPTITLNDSYISWNGQVYRSEDDTHDPPLINYTRYNNPASLTTSLSAYRADIDWNISSIADSSVIKNITLGLLANLLTFNSSQSSILNVMQMDKDRNSYPDTNGDCPDGNCLFYNDMGNGTEYNRTSITNALVYRNITLSSAAVADMQSKLATDRFSIGLTTDFSGIASIAARDYVTASQRPRLTIIYGVNGTDGSSAIEQGINNSLPNNPIKMNQQIYLLNENNQQFLGTFERITILNNQTWGFNYVDSGESFMNMPSLFRVLSIWENQTLSYQEIVDQVGLFINATKY